MQIVKRNQHHIQTTQGSPASTIVIDERKHGCFVPVCSSRLRKLFRTSWIHARSRRPTLSPQRQWFHVHVPIRLGLLKCVLSENYMTDAGDRVGQTTNSLRGGKPWPAEVFTCTIPPLKSFWRNLSGSARRGAADKRMPVPGRGWCRHGGNTPVPSSSCRRAVPRRGDGGGWVAAAAARRGICPLCWDPLYAKFA